MNEPRGSDFAKTHLKVILEQVSGEISTREACERLDLDEPAFDALLSRTLDGILESLEPRHAERKKAGERAWDSETRSRAWLEHSPACTKVVDLDFNLQYMSNAGVMALKIDDVNDLYGKPYPFDFYPESFRRQMTASLEKAICGEVAAQEASVVDTDGSKLWFHSTLVPMKDAGGQVEYIMVVSINTTERRNAEEALRDSSENFRTTLESIGDAVIAADVRGHIYQLNSVAAQLTGWTFEEARGRPLGSIFKIMNPDTGQVRESPVDKVLSSGQTVRLTDHTLLISKDGTERRIADSAAAIKGANGEISGVVLVFRDVSQEYRMQEELRRMQQLESIGSLAGGIAHDFNNLLTGLFGNLGMAKLEIAEDHPAFTFLEEAGASLDRATLLSNQLLTFSTGGKPITEETSIDEVIEAVAGFDLSGSNVLPVFEVAEDLWTVEADEGQLQQAFSNLVINADQAMPDGGHLYIKLENTDLSSNEVSTLEQGKFVKITVRDEGAGIAREHLDRVFDPYFTTKPTGRGLGLATTYSVITKHEGHIRIESKPGEGTSFVIYLRASERKKSSRTTQAPTEHSTVEATTRVLLMDDDETIRRLVSEILGRTGIQVEVANGGEQAIAMYERSAEAGQPFDAVIMDLTIPGGLGGKEAAREILKVDPKAVVIASSGYTADPVMADCAAFGFRGTIPKPYTPGKLRTVLAQILGKQN